MKKIGIFGVTANPPHVGHMKAIESALSECDEVWVSPVYKHPFGKGFIGYDDRNKMLQMIVKEFFQENNRIKLKELDREYCEEFQKIPYSFDLLSWCKINNKNMSFSLVIGEDNASPEVWNKFYKNQEILEQFGRIVVKDVGEHSTKIRQKIANGEDVEGLILSSVNQYIKKNNLFLSNFKIKYNKKT